MATWNCSLNAFPSVGLRPSGLREARILSCLHIHTPRAQKEPLAGNTSTVCTTPLPLEDNTNHLEPASRLTGKLTKVTDEQMMEGLCPSPNLRGISTSWCVNGAVLLLFLEVMNPAAQLLHFQDCNGNDRDENWFSRHCMGNDLPQKPPTSLPWLTFFTRTFRFLSDSSLHRGTLCPTRF